MKSPELWHGKARFTRDRWRDGERKVTLRRGDVVLREATRVYLYDGLLHKTRFERRVKA